ncbi:MAG: DUF3380 domain-containing protein, partial [Chloroflexi bacterium]|nr:DUF3380 domain-containing protein [Chloroflexota bacterium]
RTVQNDREAPYTGPDVDGLTNLTEAERAAIRRKLSELAPAVRHPTGTVVAEAGLYAAPSAEGAPLVTLPPDALVEVLEEQGEWLHVAGLGKTGYVRKSAVRRADQRAAAGFLRARSELQSVAMDAPASQIIPPEAAAGHPTAQALAETWNRYGGLMTVLGGELKIDPALAAAVLVAESRGRGFGPDGRMVLRFENHVFYRRWGREHAERYAQHFRYDPQEPWKGHVWRPSPDGAWRPFHGDQSAEWEVFQFACALDDTAAKLSISMGAPQIMGFNHAGIGYDSVQGMYDAFSGDERYQILGFFDFAKGPTGESEALRALQDCDLETFAAKYNGAGEAARYAGLIAERLQMLRQLRAGEAIPFGAALPTFAPMEAMEVGEAVPQAIPEELSYLPAPALGEGELHLLRADPELYGYWREHIRHGFERNDQMFRRILEGFMRPYNTTIWMYRILFGLGVLCFLAAAGLGAWTGNAVTTLVFGGLGVAAFLSYFISRPIQSLEQNLKFVTWLGILYNTYWTRLLYAMDQRTVQADLQRATQDAIADIVRLLDKHAALSAKRPRVR